MKIGIVGGIGPESTIDYYRSIICEYQKVKTDGSFPNITIESIDIKKMLGLVSRMELNELIEMLVNALVNLHSAKVDFAVIASNTPHIVFDKVRELSPIPILSIVEETCKKASELKLKKVGLLGINFTMKEPFYERCFNKSGINVIVPDKTEQAFIHEKIFSELQLGIIVKETKDHFLEIIKRMVAEHQIEAVILGCTELPLLLKDRDCDIPLLNTVQIHVQSIIREMKKIME